MRRLEGKTVVVVGAGSIAEGWSNGKACAVAYAREGAFVVCVDAVEARVQETLRTIEREGGRGLALAADATCEAEMNAVVQQALVASGRLDVMHNNVGVGGSFGAPDQIEPADWDREVAQNLTTAYLGVRCAVPAMRRQNGGVIINTSSSMTARFLKRPNVGYVASKAAVEALTAACAVAYGPDNIRVNCLRIGISETPLIRVALEARRLPPERMAEEMAKSRSKVPLRGEHGDPFDVANAAVFLASDESRYVSGVTLSVDGALAWAPI